MRLTLIQSPHLIIAYWLRAWAGDVTKWVLNIAPEIHMKFRSYSLPTRWCFLHSGNGNDMLVYIFDKVQIRWNHPGSHRRFELSRGFISILRQKIGDAGVRVVCRIHRVRFYVRPPVAALWAISIHSSRHATISIKYLTHLTRNVKLLSNWEPHIHATQIRITKYACVCIHCNIYIWIYK